MSYLKVSRRFKRTENHIEFKERTCVEFYDGNVYTGSGCGISLQECVNMLNRHYFWEQIHNPVWNEWRMQRGWEKDMFPSVQPNVVDKEIDKEDLRKNLVP